MNATRDLWFLIWSAAVALCCLETAQAGVVLFDDFGNGDLGTGGPGTINAGFLEADNGIRTSGSSVVEADGVAEITTGGADNARGIVSSWLFNPHMYSSFTVTFTVDSVTDNDFSKLIFFIQGDVLVPERPNVALRFVDLADRWELSTNVDRSGFNILTEQTGFVLDGHVDGFTASLLFDSNGVEISTVGLATNINRSVAWDSDFDYSDLSPSSRFSAWIQNTGGFGDVTPDRLAVDSVTVSAVPVPEPSGFVLWGSLLATVACSCWRRRRRLFGTENHSF